MLGLPGVIALHTQSFLTQKKVIGASESMPPLQVFGPEGLRFFIEANKVITNLRCRVIVNELVVRGRKAMPEPARSSIPGRILYMDPTEVVPIYEDDLYIVYAGLIQHTVPCFGYIIHEKDAPAKLLVEKVLARGLKPGPIFGALKRGESVLLADGSVLNGADVLAPGRRGRKVVILGDTCDPSNLIPRANDADVLVHEATLPESLQQHAFKRGHSTAAMAGAFATKIRAKNLILTHFSRRFNDSTIGQQYDAARTSYSGPVIVAEDFLLVGLPNSDATSQALSVASLLPRRAEERDASLREEYPEEDEEEEPFDSQSI